MGSSGCARLEHFRYTFVLAAERPDFDFGELSDIGLSPSLLESIHDLLPLLRDQSRYTYHRCGFVSRSIRIGQIGTLRRLMRGSALPFGRERKYRARAHLWHAKSWGPSRRTGDQTQTPSPLN